VVRDLRDVDVGETRGRPRARPATAPAAAGTAARPGPTRARCVSRVASCT